MDNPSSHYAVAPSHYELSLDKKITTSRLYAENPKEFTEKSKHKALECMRHCTGWCSLEKGGFLVDLVLKYQPDIIVEIGVWGGKSLVPMASALKAIGKGIAYGIDPWENSESVKWTKDEANLEFWSRVDHQWVLNDLSNKIEQFELCDQIQLIKSTSEEAPLIQDIDLLHVDGNHSEETSLFDVKKWVPLVRSGGWIVLDDVHWFEKGKYTTAKAAEWLDDHCIRIAEFTDQSDWAVWVKP